ncbi:hypothetical protein Scep_022508 [Stephania cephalantha]|uniref:Uncharacterized protein n=1 Tax=Stephania cephalantha TaxID=152367 RepID=A0AAP0F6B0_9MAGN
MSPLHYKRILDSKKYPKTFWDTHYGMPFYEVIGRKPEWSRRMSEGMSSITRGTVEAVVHGLVREKAILRAFPQLKCTVVDLPHVVEGAPKDPDLKFVARIRAHITEKQYHDSLANGVTHAYKRHKSIDK